MTLAQQENSQTACQGSAQGRSTLVRRRLRGRSKAGSKKRRKGHPAFVFAEDMPEDYTNKRNMHMADDTRPGDANLFEDEVEEEFDETFIHVMMYGEVDDDDDMFGF